MGFLKFLLISLTLLYYVNQSFAQEENVEYERNSLHTMLILNQAMEHKDVVDSIFRIIPFPERYNNHDLGVKVVSFTEMEEEESDNISSFIDKVNIGQKFVSKWFNRDKKSGIFNMELIKERGFYNATTADINSARSSIRGKALLEDAGENLIGHTYLLVNRILYYSKSSVGSTMSMFIPTFSMKNLDKRITSIGGFEVRVISYLYHLIWNDSIANRFYEIYYTENPNDDIKKFENYKADTESFKMKYIGRVETTSSSRQFTSSKDPRALLAKVTTRALDKNIAQLQHDYEPFRIKAPLISTEPLQAYIGLKEDVSTSRQYEVLERVQNEDGSIKYDRVGIIKPIENKIWDNRYMSYEDEGINMDIKSTTFEKLSGKDFHSGMLIREIK